MKNLIWVILLLPLCASAKSWETPNNAGGKIVITDSVCQGYPNLFYMFSRSTDGTMIEGCWRLYEGYIRVVYNDGTQRAYDARGFVEVKTY